MSSWSSSIPAAPAAQPTAGAPATAAFLPVAAPAAAPPAAGGGWAPWLYARFTGKEASPDPGGEKLLKWAGNPEAAPCRVLGELYNRQARPGAFTGKLVGNALYGLQSVVDSPEVRRLVAEFIVKVDQ